MRVLAPLAPSLPTAVKLFVTGSTVGPLVDSLHNQCLLKYDILPVNIPFPPVQQHELPTDVPSSAFTPEYLFSSSLAVPPLLGIAYVVLGGILPRLFQLLIDSIFSKSVTQQSKKMDASDNTRNSEIMSFWSWENEKALSTRTSLNDTKGSSSLRLKALLAVTSTALIIKLSEYLETNPHSAAETNLLVMIIAAVSQWLLLDGSLASLLAAVLTSIGGPLSELPFVASGFWHYVPEAGDYFPLKDITYMENVFAFLLGDEYRDLVLSSITGPCYFAVTMDAIALGRWFDVTNKVADNSS